jgi:hypothetical protein
MLKQLVVLRQMEELAEPAVPVEAVEMAVLVPEVMPAEQVVPVVRQVPVEL